MTTDKHNKRPNVPPLRFPEFTDEWKTYKVSDVLDFYSTNSLSWDQLEYSDGELRNLHYGLIHVGLPTLVNLKDDLLPTIKEGNTPKNYTLCLNGDVAFADASEDTNDVAKAIELVETDGNKVVFGLHTIHGRDNKGLTTLGFKGYAFSSKVFHDQIKCIAQGTKIYSISSKNFTECYIGIPSKAEQSKIARLLSLLDRRIAAQSGLIEDLQKLKAALYQKVFSSIPGEEVALSNLAKIIKGKQINGTELFDSGNYYVMNGGTLPSGFYNEYNTPANTISISEGGNSCGYVQFNNVPFWSGGHCYTLQITSKQIHLSYLYHYLKHREQVIMALRIGSGLPNIQKKDLERFPILMPTIEIQQKLSRIFDSLQRKEEVEKSILNRCLSQKQYLLQKMFI